MEFEDYEGELERLADATGHWLLARGWTLAVAESCTGGWIAQAVTAIAGSSAWFDCGFVTYSNAAKTRLLDVPASLIEAHGAVSEPVVEAMARGALAHSAAQTALAVSGIAGPGGARPGKPVGTVCFAWVWPDRAPLCETVHLAGDRRTVRARTVMHALDGLRRAER